jgi:hypothetical protein
VDLFTFLRPAVSLLWHQVNCDVVFREDVASDFSHGLCDRLPGGGGSRLFGDNGRRVRLDREVSPE